MHITIRHVLISTFSFALVACGGGSSNDDSAQPKPILLLTPTSLTFEQDVDDTSKSTIEIQIADKTISGLPKVMISGDVNFTQELSQIDTNKHNLELTVPNGLTAGTHTGTVNISLCIDQNCAKTYSGSLQKIPYTVKVNPIVNLTTLTPINGLADWEMFQGNAAHTGYVPITIDPKKINRRWSWQKPASDTESLTTISSSQGKMYVTSSGYFAAAKLYSINESDASNAWIHDFGSIFAITPPSVSNGKVFVASSGHEDTAMWQFDALTGAKLFKTSFNSQWEHYLSPTIKNGKVYTNGGTYGGVNSFNLVDGTSSWFQELNQYDMWTPAVDENYVYTYTGNTFNVLDAKNGHKIFDIQDSTFNWAGYSINSAPVIGSLDNVIVVNGVGENKSNNLLNYNITQKKLNWTISGQFQTTPAVANKVIYVTNTSPFRLEARNETDGALMWSWKPNTETTKFFGNIIVTTNLVFIGTDTGIYAIEKATHVPVWHFKKTGNLAITSNGVLLVSNASTIYAINLK